MKDNLTYRFLFCLTISVLVGCSSKQTNMEIIQEALNNGKIYLKFSQDFKDRTLVKYAHPKIIQHYGSAAKYIESRKPDKDISNITLRVYPKAKYYKLTNVHVVKFRVYGSAIDRKTSIRISMDYDLLMLRSFKSKVWYAIDTPLFFHHKGLKKKIFGNESNLIEVKKNNLKFSY
ncbi:hypothetical protein MNBD_GAMMA12-2924 [hydrothermal vent metagenome]|uniref:Lipoprotein n=1 Tax=hydrothermal vent metagenome TaxID=652676 RepID=A0A3B0YKQ0_9ZZZZ